MSGSGHRSGNTKRRALAAGYGGATAAVLAAILARWLLEPWVGDQAPYILVFGAAAVAVWLGGAGPAVCAAVVGYTLINYLYIEPKAMLGIARASDAVNLVLFVLACTLIIALGQAMRRARDRARISEAEARERAAQLELADAKKSEFLAVLSHELRNPLAPLRAGVEILKLKSAGAPTPSILEMMERQVVHLTRLIDDVLALSRIDRGKLQLRKEYIALDAVVRNESETALPALEPRRHELTVRSEAEPLYVHGDALRLSQVLSNLLNDAAKFTPAGGRIEVALRAENGHAVVQRGGQRHRPGTRAPGKRVRDVRPGEARRRRRRPGPRAHACALDRTAARRRASGEKRGRRPGRRVRRAPSFDLEARGRSVAGPSAGGGERRPAPRRAHRRRQRRRRACARRAPAPARPSRRGGDRWRGGPARRTRVDTRHRVHRPEHARHGRHRTGPAAA